jgi:hypothetical protein
LANPDEQRESDSAFELYLCYVRLAVVELTAQNDILAEGYFITDILAVIFDEFFTVNRDLSRELDGY